MKLVGSACRILCWSSVLVFGPAALAAAPKVPARMQAIFADPGSGAGALKLETVAVPAPQPGQVLVQIYAAGANPVDWMIRAHDHAPPPPAGILGREIAGVVVARGAGVADYKIGDKVIVALPSNGAYAQYVVADPADMAMKPRKLSFEQAAGIPVAAFTAQRMVVVGEVKKYQRVLVIGAAGGVGSAAVQLARAVGAHVIADASSQHHAYLKSLGADEIIDYDKESVADRAKNLDAVLNMVGGENSAAISYVRRGGVMLSAAGDYDEAACVAAGITCFHIRRQGPTNGELIRQVARLADEGRYQVKIEKSFPLAQTAAAFDFGLSGNREGKIVIDMHRNANRP